MAGIFRDGGTPTAAHTHGFWPTGDFGRRGIFAYGRTAVEGGLDINQPQSRSKLHSCM
jgi:hypothetical protein